MDLIICINALCNDAPMGNLTTRSIYEQDAMVSTSSALKVVQQSAILSLSIVQAAQLRDVTTRST